MDDALLVHAPARALIQPDRRRVSALWADGFQRLVERLSRRVHVLAPFGRRPLLGVVNADGGVDSRPGQLRKGLTSTHELESIALIREHCSHRRAPL